MKCPNDQCHYFSNVNSDCCYTCGAKDLNLASNLVCPFCKGVDFDLVGLKHHLENYCEVYQSTITVDEERRLRKIKGEG